MGYLRGIIAIYLGLFLPLSALAQVASSAQEIQHLLDSDSLPQARHKMAMALDLWKSTNTYDSLYRYLPLVGNIKLNNGDKKTGLKKAENLLQEIKSHASPHFVVEAVTETAYLYESASNLQEAYTLMDSAIPYARENGADRTDLAGIFYRKGYFASGMGNFPLAKKNYLHSLMLLKKSGEKDYVFFNQLYNALGGMMWQEAKLDSAKYYFQEAVAVLEKTDENDLMNRYYRPALIKLNLSVLLNALGKNQEAIANSQEAISGFQEYIKRSTDAFRIQKAKGHQCMVMDNLASFYNTMGAHARAQELIEYSLKQKRQLYDGNNINIIISHIILAEAQTANRDFEEAAKNADTALELLQTSDGANLYWEGAALATRATIYEMTGNVERATYYYERAEKVLRESTGNELTKDFLDNLLEYSLFAAKTNNREKALSLARETYNFTHTGDFKNTLQEFYHTINLAQVNYLLQEYPAALRYSEEALNFNLIKNDERIGTADSILSQFRKPQALLVNAQAQYHMATEKNTAFLKKLLAMAEEAISILDQRKKVVTHPEDIRLLMAENEELLDFAEQLRMELYQQTGEERYLDKLVALHESRIYNRIRSQLDLRDNVLFKHIPEKVVKREKKLKEEMANSLKTADSGSINSFFGASATWGKFMDSLKLNFPKYYKMRYQTLEMPIDDLQRKIPEGTTVVRYLFIEDDLYAFVISPSKKKITKLKFDVEKDHILSLQNNAFSVEKSRPLLFELYRSLWFPIEDQVLTTKVVIIPDGPLFNLSFEMLTPKPMKNFSDLQTNSLLATYDISYNFSLLLYKDRQKVVDYPSRFIAFAPGFDKNMKREYQLAIKDSLGLDKTYLTLLPQPFSENLARQYAKIFDGDFFTNAQASKELFMNRAKEHKIIHIGTHAESNNISPELSRLIFAKSLDSSAEYDDNSLYSFEIYNLDLSSNLAILTACNTGLPSYQAGEGMISLAHAFNYAGSESILTSLWEIDEQSSAQIVGMFYNNLDRGMAKDEALRKAKLSYLATARGRTAAPQYWAGLVLIGEASPLELRNTVVWWWYMAAGVAALMLFLLIVYRKRLSSVV